MNDLIDTYRAADMLLSLDGPYDPEAVVRAATAITELVRRLNHATLRSGTFEDPGQLYEVVGRLSGALSGLDQTLTQLAQHLDRWATDPRVGHDHDHDPAVTCVAAAHMLRDAATGLGTVTSPLDDAHVLTGHLRLDDAEPVTPQGFVPLVASPPSRPTAPPPPGPAVGPSRSR